jgi:putative ABC transport system substrate-binding protein
MMRRREFITLLGGVAAAWPVAARAQQQAMPVIGFLSTRASYESEYLTAAFRRRLAESRYLDGQNLERIPVMFEHSRHGERIFCILAG